MMCQLQLSELVAISGRSGEEWLKALDNGRGPMACAQLLACAPDSDGSQSLRAAIDRDSQLQSEVVMALAELCGALAERLAGAADLTVEQVFHTVIRAVEDGDAGAIFRAQS
jgi:hypothetical protein